MAADNDAPVETLPPVDELAKRNGSVEKGRAVFAKNCQLCHRVGIAGINFGPDLSGVGARLTKRDIYKSILEPAAVIDPKYRGVVVQTTDGGFLSGLVEGRDGSTLKLRVQGGKLESIPVASILFEEKQEGTFMPAGSGTRDVDERPGRSGGVPRGPARGGAGRRVGWRGAVTRVHPSRAARDIGAMPYLQTSDPIPLPPHACRRMNSPRRREAHGVEDSLPASLVPLPETALLFLSILRDLRAFAVSCSRHVNLAMEIEKKHG